MKRARSILVVAALLLSASFLLRVNTASAGTEDFIIDRFDADYTLSREDKQGRLKIVENIDLTFNDFNHGILRAIPKKYGNRSLKLTIHSISSSSGAGAHYTTYTQSDNLVLKIGDPEKTITGKHNYRIEYTVDNVIRFYDDHDELYWDINGDQWQQIFSDVSADFTVPDDLEFSSSKPVCFTGSYGSTASDCLVSADELGSPVVMARTNKPLTAGQTLSVVVGFQKGYFTPETLQEKLRENAGTIAKIALPPLLIGGYAIRRWLKYGRDPKGRGTIVPEYDAPDGLRPAELGTVVDFVTDQKDITATIIDLAVRRYIRIIEVKKDRKLLKDTLEYSLELTNADFTDLQVYEVKILNGIFGSEGMQAGAIIELKSLRNKFYTDMATAKKLVTDSVTTQGYFVNSPLGAAGRLWVLAIIHFFAIAGLGGLLGFALIIGLGISLIITVVCAIAMPARTVKGVHAREKAQGLELYLKTAEKDRINMMSAPNAPYAEHSTGPPKTVELFEKLLPYAIIFGVEKQWAEEFKDIYDSAPDWYAGSNIHAFNSLYLANSLNSSMGSALDTAYSAPSSSSGSGFGGGGFSGGGGGGGGGGGW